MNNIINFFTGSTAAKETPSSNQKSEQPKESSPVAAKAPVAAKSPAAEMNSTSSSSKLDSKGNPVRIRILGSRLSCLRSFPSHVHTYSEMR